MTLTGLLGSRDWTTPKALDAFIASVDVEDVPGDLRVNSGTFESGDARNFSRDDASTSRDSHQSGCEISTGYSVLSFYWISQK